MYREDQRIIAEYARRDPLALRDVGIFVQATINNFFERVPDIMQDARENGRNCKYWTPNKRKSYDALGGEARKLFSLVGMWDKGEIDDKTMLAHIVELPGFGIVKAGFWCQLVGGKIGSLDRHNLRKAGMQERTYAKVPTSTEFLNARLTSYIAVCETLGGSEILWNEWCNLLAALRPQSFADGEAVSKLHVTCIVGKPEAY